jgi:hypothetical protein
MTWTDSVPRQRGRESSRSRMSRTVTLIVHDRVGHRDAGPLSRFRIRAFSRVGLLNERPSFRELSRSTTSSGISMGPLASEAIWAAPRSYKARASIPPCSSVPPVPKP